MKEEIKKYIKSVIKNAGVATFLTINFDNMPEARALCNAANSNNDKIGDDFVLYFATGSFSPKVEQILKNKNTSVYYYSETSNLSLFGDSEIVSDKKLKDSVWQESWKDYYPNGGKNDPTYCVIKFTPRKFKYYSIKDGDFEKIECKIY